LRPSSPGAAPVTGQSASFGNFWTVSGSIGSASVIFDPLFQTQVTGSLDTGTGTHRIEVQNSTNAVLFTRRFRPMVPQTESAFRDFIGRPSFFELVPVTTGAAKIILFDGNNTQLGTLVLGGTAPTVS